MRGVLRAPPARTAAPGVFRRVAATSCRCPERGVGGEFIHRKECGRGHARRFTHAVAAQLMKSRRGRAFTDQREHDVAAVAVREPGARRKLLGVAVEDGEVVGGAAECVGRCVERPLVAVLDEFLLSVLAHSGARGAGFREVRRRGGVRDG